MRNTFPLFLKILASLWLFIACKQEQITIANVKENHGIQLKFMDTTVSPKNDFFRYVNGTWLATTAIPKDRAIWGSFHELRKKTDKDMLDIIAIASKDTTINEKSNSYKATALYNTIVDTTARNKQGITPIKSKLSIIEAISNLQELQKYLVDMQQYGNTAFFDANIRPDAKNSNRNALYITPSRLGLPSRDYYVNDDQDAIEKRTAYTAHITKMLQYLGDSPEKASDEASKILAYEIELATPQLDKVALRDNRKTYHPRKPETLQEYLPVIQWNSYLKNIGIPAIDTLIVAQPEYMKSLKKQLTQRKLPIIKAYLKWNLFNDSSKQLSTTIEKDHWEFYGKIVQGAIKQLPINERALTIVNQTIGESLGQRYVASKFPPEAKTKAKAMIANVIEAYSRRINALPWMSDSTKTKAIKKLETTQIKIGYPDQWKDYSTLQITAPNAKGSYLENMRTISKWKYKKELAKLTKPVDKTEWFMPPQTVNAYYNPYYNEIVFPAAILQPPFYDYKADAAVNYGGIGAVIGHEISHGFDDSGARFDADGNLNNWWTPNDLEKFEGLGKKLAAQYSAIEVLPDITINGAFTLGENIGDLGGVTAAYDGLQLYFEKEGKPEAIDGFTAEQRFFISWATVWRTKMRPEALKTRIKTDPHAPGMYRAYMPLINIDAFYDAFDITENDALYLKPKERVRIW